MVTPFGRALHAPLLQLFCRHANTKSLYGTGAIRLTDETRQAERVGGVQWTIRGGVVHDAKQLLADVKEMVTAANAA